MKLKWNKTKKHNRRSAGKVVTGLLVGSVVGATVGWLTAPASGQEMRRRLMGEVKSAREKAKTSAGNVESQARELAEDIRENTGHLERRVASRTTASSRR